MERNEMIYWLKKSLEYDSFPWKPIPEAIKMAIKELESCTCAKNTKKKGAER